MAKAQTRAIQTPGEEIQGADVSATPAADADRAAAVALADNIDSTLKAIDQKASPSVADLMAIIEQQAAQVAALTSAVQNISRAQAPAARATEELPEIDSLDKAKIKTPVLTKQGWYVPETFGANPNAAGR
jgi:hypothetical protein